MPGFDRTGPEGDGPRTGRAMGKCASPKKEDPVREDETDYQTGRWGRRRGGYGRGFRGGWKSGPGRGMGRGFRGGRNNI